MGTPYAVKFANGGIPEYDAISVYGSNTVSTFMASMLRVVVLSSHSCAECYVAFCLEAESSSWFA
jgi:hypothetical protein